MLLVFAGKRVGLALLNYLIARPEPIGHVVVASEADESIRHLCRQHNIACTTFERLDIAALRTVTDQYEWLLDLWSPHILSREILALARRRANLHPSLVPHARGADSTAWCIRKGLPTGVSILEMTDAIDAGGVYAQREVQAPFPISGKELHARLQDELVALFQEAWPRMLTGEIEPQPQAAGGSYHRRKDTNADRRQQADTIMSLREAVRWMLAHDFHPGTTAELEQDGERFRLQLTVTKIP
jgi:methionyl-tRNA formyltransferase